MKATTGNRELECQRSARQPTLLSSVLGENLENDALDHAELDCRRSAWQSAVGARQETGRSALPPIVPQTVERDPQSAEGYGPERSWALRWPAQPASACRSLKTSSSCSRVLPWWSMYCVRNRWMDMVRVSIRQRWCRRSLRLC